VTQDVRKQYGLDEKRDLQSVSIALSFLIGITSSLITVLLTPRLQHLFWVRQKRFDLRAKNLESLHALSAKIFEYLGPDWATGELTGADSQDRDTKLEDTLAREWRTVADQTRFLFSKEACDQLAQFNSKLSRVLFRHLPDPPEKAYEIWDEFVHARDLSFEILYKELFDYHAEQNSVTRAIGSGTSFIRHKLSRK
jgi:hypothetical protein